MKQLVTTAAFIAAMGLVAPSAFAITAAQQKAVKKAVTSVPVPEMPAKAAELVSQASKEDREAVAVTAVRAGIYKSRSSARLLVSAVVKAAPEVAAAVTMAASEMESGQAGYIATAAMIAAPESKTKIVQAATLGRTLASTTATLTPAPLSTTAPSVTTVSASSGRLFTPRGAAGGPATAPVQQSNNPINNTQGGGGDGTFNNAQANPGGTPTEVPYDQPR